jgi:flagellar hook-associated protein 2
MGTTSNTTPATFLGNSAFSADLQQVITRAVNIASLPITQLQNQLSVLTNQQTELQTLGSKFQSLQNALDSIDSASSADSFSASVDDPSVASALVGSGAQAGNYSVDILSVGSQTNTISPNTLLAVADPASGNISASSAFTLTVDGQTFSISDASNSLNELAQAINASGAGVQATIVNVGGSTPDYRLSLQGTHYAPTSIQLNDGSQDLLNTLATGSYVSYKVNGADTTATSDTRTFSISAGVTVHALTTGTANIGVAQDVAGIQSAIGSFVSAFNAAVDELQQNRGQNGGALAGQSIISQLSGALRNLADYTPTSGSPDIQSVADLGLTFDQTGHLQFDSSVYSAAAGSSLSNVLNFLGSETGGGFLQAAHNILTSVTDSTNGLVANDISATGASVTNLTKKISSKQDTVTQMQTNLIQQMSRADAAISAMEQQVTQITNLFAAMQQASKSITG